ncbi:MAG: ABC transporter permease [Halobacteriaceae archaeon]
MTSTDDDAAAPDGGAAAETGETPSPFDRVSETDVSRLDRYRRTFDAFVRAPLMIALDDWRARIGLAVLTLYLLMGTVGVVLYPVPHPHDGPRLVLPLQTMQYPLGTDGLGQPILAQVVHATPAMLKMILAGAVFTTTMATVVGTVGGYKGGTVDRVLTVFTDVMMTIPGLPLVIVIAVILEPRSPLVVGVVLTINAWAGLARTIRSQVLTIRDESYVEAARVMGAPTSLILAGDVLPNLMPYIAINFVNAARQVIFASVGLYFLGILPFTNLNWGVMMNLAYSTAGALYTLDTAHWLLIPMFTIILLSFGFIMFAQGTDRIFNPRVRARHAKTIADEDGGYE